MGLGKKRETRCVAGAYQRVCHTNGSAAAGRRVSISAGRVEWTVRIADRDLRGGVCRQSADQGKAKNKSGCVIAEELCDIAPQCSHRSHAARCLQNLLRDRTAFRAVAVEQAVRADSLNNEREFPCKVARVLHTRVHSLAARRTVNVGRISSEKDPPGAVVRHLAFVDAKRGEPNRVGGAYSA